MRSFVYGSFVILVVTVNVCLAAPKPALVPSSTYWTLDIRFEHPEQIVLESTKGKGSKRFWYTIVTLTNKTGKDVDFYPKCELMTDTLQILPAGKGVAPAVFEHIKIRHQGKYPFLESLEKTGNKLLQGEDNTRDIAIIWPDFDAKAKSIKVFVTGLSNETAIVDHPTEKDENGKPRKVYLRKTLELNYKIGGDPKFRSDAQIKFDGKRWIMR